MGARMNRSLLVCLLALEIIFGCAFAPLCLSAQSTPKANDRLGNAFTVGWMLVDSNGDGVPDAMRGKIVVPASPSAAENAAAANWAARLTHASSGVTLPIVVTDSDSVGDGPHVWLGERAVPAGALRRLASLISRLQKDEGGVFVADNDLVVVGKDDAGLFFAASSFAARSPYQWEVPGEIGRAHV